MRIVVLFMLTLFLAGCGVNIIPALQQQASARWDNVRLSFQGRANLVPVLLLIVKQRVPEGADAIIALSDARDAVAEYNISAQTASDPQALSRYWQRQQALTQALARVTAMADAHSALRDDQNFARIVADIHDAELRTLAAVQDYDIAVNTYNAELNTLHGKWWHRILYPQTTPLQSFEGLTDREGRTAPAT